MTKERPSNIWNKVLGDTRDQRVALREAGFPDEARASDWARDLVSHDGGQLSELELVRRVRRARPDLTLATATYIARRTVSRWV